MLSGQITLNRSTATLALQCSYYYPILGRGTGRFSKAFFSHTVSYENLENAGLFSTSHTVFLLREQVAFSRRYSSAVQHVALKSRFPGSSGTCTRLFQRGFQLAGRRLLDQNRDSGFGRRPVPGSSVWY